MLAAGTDITHWFDPDTREPKKWVDPATGQEDFICPTGRFLHVPEPGSKKDRGMKTPWWEDFDKFVVGRLTRKARKINVMNTLTKEEQELVVGKEETLNEILDRYLVYNSHATSYTWKRLGEVLKMDQTLEENGIPDES